MHLLDCELVAVAGLLRGSFLGKQFELDCLLFTERLRMRTREAYV